MSFARLHLLHPHPQPDSAALDPTVPDCAVPRQRRAYLPELLEQLGLPFSQVSVPPDPAQTDLLLRISGAGLSSAELAFLHAGGRILAFALEQDMTERDPLMWSQTPQGNLPCCGAWPLWDAHTHSGTVEVGGNTVPLFQVRRHGQGELWHVSVNVMSTVVTLQQGRGPVTQDLPSAPDGSAETAEGLLKADDGCVLPWDTRNATSSGQPFYGVAFADRWREWLLDLLVSHLRPLQVVRVAPWPHGAKAAFHLSLDSDGNDPAHAETTLDYLESLGVKATWCALDGGYGPEFHAQAHAKGHEIALHYNALESEGGQWSTEAFHTQFQALNAQAPAPVTTNKNHYTRFEGWDELFQWCDAHSLTLDSTRGGSKMGNRGFPFGTCFPYRPAHADGSGQRHRVFEQGFLTQDINFEPARWGDHTIIEPLLDEVEAVGGCAHFLCHPAHIHNLAAVRQSLKQTVEAARKREFHFMLGRELAQWSQERRAVQAQVSAEQVTFLNLPVGAVIQVVGAESIPATGSTLTVKAKEYAHD